MNTDNERNLTISEGDRSPQDRRGGDIVPVPTPSSSYHGLPGVCTAGTTGELTAAKTSEASPEEEITGGGGGSSDTSKMGLESAGEAEGDIYVSSREEPSTPIPKGLLSCLKHQEKKPSKAVARSGRTLALKATAGTYATPEGKPCNREARKSRLEAGDLLLGDKRPEIPDVRKKRKKKVESSSELETSGEIGSPRRLRPRGLKTIIMGARPSRKKRRSTLKGDTKTESEEEWPTDEEQLDEEQPAEEQPIELSSASKESEGGELSPPPPAEKVKKKMMRGRKPFLDKVKVAKRVEMELEEVPQDVDELRDRSTPSLGAIAQRWIDEIDYIKNKCNTMQFTLKGRLTERTRALTILVQLLAERLQDNGDIAYLKKQNIEKSSRIDIYEKEVNNLKKEVSVLTELVGELQNKALKAMEEKEKVEASICLLKTRMDRATSPMPSTMEKSPANTYGTCKKCRDTYLEVDEAPMSGPSSEDVRVRPKRSCPLKPDEGGEEPKKRKELEEKKIIRNTYPGVESLPLKPEPENQEERLVRRITEEVLRHLKPKEEERRKETPSTKKGDQAGPPLSRQTPRIRVMGNVQLVPPRDGAPLQARPPLTPGTPGSTGMSEGGAEDPAKWSTVVKRKVPQKKEKKREEAKPTWTPRDNTGTRTDSDRGPPPTRRAPRAAVVSIKGADDSFSYADAMRKAREGIALKDLGVGNTKIKKAMNGALLIEVPGPDGDVRAERLKGELARVLGDSAKVTRPVARGDLRIIGMDVSVTPEEVATAAAKAGGCPVEDVRTSPMIPMRNGMYMTWISLPLKTAIRVSGLRRLSIGWTSARVQLLDAKPIQCFRCWQFGHVQAKCATKESRRDQCLRCDEAGHKAYQCSAQPKCALCAAEGKHAQHRIGAANCGSRPKTEPRRTNVPSFKQRGK